LNQNDLPDDDILLAEGFANHCVGWARKCAEAAGATRSADDIKRLHRAAFMASKATSDGHVCINLATICEDSCDDRSGLRALLEQSGVVGSEAAPGAMPLILDDEGRLYLHKFFDAEKRLARRLTAASLPSALPEPHVIARLNELFSSTALTGEYVDWQKVAAALALIRPVTIISGGPGTGKTTTVVNILACLLTQNSDCRIALAAPTGKAAARMLEAVNSRAEHLPTVLKQLMPSTSYTVHRLLGVTPSPGVFRHDADNPLPIDALIVDEASMLDLALAARLLEAVPPSAKIILLGDRNQLAAVEAGAVFSELCADPRIGQTNRALLETITGIPAERLAQPARETKTGFTDAAVWFTRNYRFSKTSGVGELSTRIVEGNADETLAWLGGHDSAEVTWLEEAGERPSAASREQMVNGFMPFAEAVTQQAGPEAVFEAFNKFRVLCAVRNGDWGVESLNDIISSRLRHSLPQALIPIPGWYVGRPVLVRRNDYGLRLFNGDVGIALLNAEGELVVFFPDGEAGFREIPPARLPDYETAFAMTVHKAQGSEFDRIVVVLPAGGSRVSTRELLYTAVTRAKKNVTLVASAESITTAVTTRTERETGLRARLLALCKG
jgi:exodeoxyribonuclease V alpha subunit